MRTASLTLVLKDTIRDGGSEALYSTLFTINYTKKNPMPMHNVDFVQYDAPVSFMTLYPIPEWQKLGRSTGGTRRKVWTRSKILSPNIRYFVAN